MKAHYLHLVKLGISLKYIKKDIVDILLNETDISFDKIKNKLKKEQWINLWRVYIEKSIMGLFVKHGLLDKKLYLVIMDDMINKAKQKKSITGAMVAVQKNLLSQKIIERAYNVFIISKIKIPEDIQNHLHKEGFITGDNKIFTLGFDIDEIEPLNEEEQKSIEKIQNSKDKPTIFADSSNHEETQKINYDANPENNNTTSQSSENISVQEETKVLYQKNENSTEEMCQDIMASEDIPIPTIPSQSYTTIISIIGSALILTALTYFLWFSNNISPQIAQIKNIATTLKSETDWNNTQTKYTQILHICDKILIHTPNHHEIRLQKQQYLYNFFQKALEQRSFYLANAIKNEYFVTTNILLQQQQIDSQQLKESNDKLAQEFDKAVRRE